jgi:hypothetical protein
MYSICVYTVLSTYTILYIDVYVKYIRGLTTQCIPDTHASYDAAGAVSMTALHMLAILLRLILGLVLSFCLVSPITDLTIARYHFYHCILRKPSSICAHVFIWVKMYISRNILNYWRGVYNDHVIDNSITNTHIHIYIVIRRQINNIHIYIQYIHHRKCEN